MYTNQPSCSILNQFHNLRNKNEKHNLVRLSLMHSVVFIIGMEIDFMGRKIMEQTMNILARDMGINKLNN